jgi:hypothetical protein
MIENSQMTADPKIWPESFVMNIRCASSADIWVSGKAAGTAPTMKFFS